MKNIENIWSDLEREHSGRDAFLYKRYSANINPDVFLALKGHEKHRCIAARISSGAGLNLKKWVNQFKDIKIERFPDEYTGKTFLLIVLLNENHKDIFSTLCGDLIHQVAHVVDEKKLIEVLINRLEKWRKLFEKIRQGGLTDAAQQGLYGELFFLRKFLRRSTSPESCIESWKGPERELQDFQYSDWAVEVKTTCSKNHQKIHISSERQLDTSLVSNIFLVHYSLETRQKFGETINDIVDELRNSLSESPASLSLFDFKLAESGYFDIHRHLYGEKGFSIREEKIYKIGEGFPRITESQVPSGVGDVRYSIIVADSGKWQVGEEEMFDFLKF